MNNDLDSLKRNWQQFGHLASSAPATSPFAPASTVKAISNHQKLMDYYRRFSIIGFIFIFVVPFNLEALGFPLWDTILTMLYFAAMSGLCYRMYRKVKALDFGNTPTITLLEQVESIYAAFNRLSIIGICLATPIIALMLYFLADNYYALLGGIAGGILGLIIGLINKSRVRRYIREIRAELADALAQ